MTNEIDQKVRRALLEAFPVPPEDVHGDWEHVVQFAASRPTLVGRATRGRHRSRRGTLRVGLVAAALVLFLLCAGLAIAAVSGVRIPGINGFTPDPIPAHMLPPGTPIPIAPSILQTTNDWLVSDGYKLVAVYAGAAGSPSGGPAPTSQGRVAIVRQDLESGRQTVSFVDAGDTGELTIIDAPSGASVEESAVTADITLRAADGQTYVLHLATDTIERASP